MEIRDPGAADEAAWKRLWAGYTLFYQADLPAEITEDCWRRMLDPACPLFGRVAEADGGLVGFSTYILHEATWTRAPVCYLEDLFVDPEARGSGVGRALLQDLIDRARKRGWSRLYWHTNAGNQPARRLYDHFAIADDFVRYRMSLD